MSPRVEVDATQTGSGLCEHVADLVHRAGDLLDRAEHALRVGEHRACLVDQLLHVAERADDRVVGGADGGLDDAAVKLALWTGHPGPSTLRTSRSFTPILPALSVTVCTRRA